MAKRKTFYLHDMTYKVVDDILRRIRYESGAFTCWYKTPTEREYNALKGIIEDHPKRPQGGTLERSKPLLAWPMMRRRWT